MSDEQRELVLTIFKIVAAGLLVAGTIAVPTLPAIVAIFIDREPKKDRKKIYNALRYAKQKKWVRLRESKDGIEVLLTDVGKEKWQMLELEEPLFDEKWDGKWRIVIFDIPDKKKRLRDGLRRQLRLLGFKQLNESVWITPYQCVDQIAALRQIYGLYHYVTFITAEEVEGRQYLIDSFNLER